MANSTMKLFVLVAIIVSITYVTPAGTAQIAQAPRSKDGLIAHVEHNGLSFAIKIDAADNRFLTIDIPRKTGFYARSSLPAVRLKVLWSGDSTIEGSAELMPGAISMGGWDEIYYRFALQRHTVVDDIHSVTISIGDQTYTVMPF
jgi:hypothetical protein